MGFDMTSPENNFIFLISIFLAMSVQFLAHGVIEIGTRDFDHNLYNNYQVLKLLIIS
tara:strand:+ start:222 stop:392 length:171 start_codon:yes stop_codon:yes gene_type:complete